MGQPMTIMWGGQPMTVDSDVVSGLSFGNSGGGFGMGGTVPRKRYRTRIREANNNINTAQSAFDTLNNMDSTPSQMDGAYNTFKATPSLAESKEALATAKDEQLASGLTAGFGAAPQVVGGIVGGIQAQKRLNKLKKFGIPDLMPESLKQGMGEAQLSAASAKVSNYGQQANQIENNANMATNQVVAGATSPDQVIQGATRVQGMRNRAYGNLASQGAASQQERKNRLNEFRKIRAQYDDENRKTRESLITDATNARNQNFLNAGSGIARGVLLAGM